MIKLIEFLGRLVVRGYRRAAVLERKVAEKNSALAGKLNSASLEAGMKACQADMKARQADTKADQLSQFFKA